MQVQNGPADLWVSFNPNNKENPIVLEMVTGEVYKFNDLKFVEKYNLIADSPGTSAIVFLENLRCAKEFWLGFC